MCLEFVKQQNIQFIQMVNFNLVFSGMIIHAYVFFPKRFEFSYFYHFQKPSVLLVLRVTNAFKFLILNQ